ncbi:MAG: isochorismatase family cysteine hydrolase [Candidatus Nanohaloarchaea archaeon]|nr:isochorismatase family cysteine hydrolase [Candidatus Nanohaloarchaea archaeon]
MPYPGVSAVVIVDFQNEWQLDTSPFSLGTISLTATKCKTLVHEAFERNLPVIYTRHLLEDHPDDAFSPFEERSEIYEELPQDQRITLIEKHNWNPFAGTDLDQILQQNQVDHVVVGGLAVNAGVRSCAEFAWDLGYDVTLVEDCSLAESSRIMQQTLDDLQMYRNIEVEILKDFDQFL